MYKQPNDYVRQCKACGEKIRLVKGAERWHAFNAAPSAEGMWRITSRWQASTAQQKNTVTALAGARLESARAMGEQLFQPHMMTCPANPRAKILKEKRAHGRGTRS
ncbi:hypothetical protein ACQX1P_03980 [Corynebacterium diphtheriae]|uniref:hypothetical protein n=1 Tax=Corynebacterium TaxID=1716 RepID=UPI0013C7E37A|nr:MULTISPECIES: hypothetical protein [Corynebacterium]MBG9330159.1 hypothetical protein [Corynebacterium belfantii]MBG9336962.1 hypothetical protein [Corynebacterium diphtheriae bv. gravis]CAB0626812.1 hypothetical protein CIP107570_00118 [Corynebacterium diphtheriae]